ncbi:centrosome and spindle pole associated protein 1-like [Clarias gariepinus]|uniref:centrosome and spindle pole associated protein 1-like n=1 Tax=Clarias gariepinus TaxID=13013 RepID=UPI00234E1603|nr:centrosome and spindle pole associated protein 1-like [Clarias gariepinus]
MTVYLPDLLQPDRIKQFGSARREHEGRRRDVLFKPGIGLDTPRANEDKKTQDVKREPPKRPSMAFQSPVLEYSATPGQLGNTTSTGVRNSGITAFSENFHKGLSGAIGEMVPPRPSSHHGISSPEIGAYPSNRHHRPKEHVESYRDALKQQIEDRKERRRREREENERYEAKVEAEMKASEPWGRGGAGAPLRDDRGNLIISPFTQPSPYARGNVFRELPTPQQLREQKKYKECLKQQIEEKRRMEVERRKEVRLEEKEQQEERKKIECRHRPNDEAYVYPESRNRRAIASPYWNGDTPRPEDKDSSLQKISNEVSSFTQPSPYARGNVFREFLTSQQLLQQKRYRESLKQQIEEKRRMEVERREQLRLEVEKEKRLAEDTAHKQRQFEEEQEKKRRKKMQQNTRNQELIRQADERRREAEKKSKEEEEKANDALKQQYEQERQARLEQEFRTRSPPIPTIQKRLGIQISPRPPSGDSQRSATASSQNSRNQELIRQAEERYREAEKKRKEEEENANVALKQQYEQERKARLEQEFRTCSPPIPTIQKRLGIQISPRTPSGDSQGSATASSQNAKNQGLIRQADEQRKEAEKKKKEEAEKTNNALKQQYEQERKAPLKQEFRTRSPPIPTIQKRLGIQISPRPPSGDSQRSATASSKTSRM